ncbi:hypothetical protein RirG_126730 [Rhizophagus irregularis DAOM 197198w]|uniref:4-hydroxyphenylpyruvate dioxygenase n=1 Tax=Rhizophagus irregularis (strain DAOM 197198w) TaxID=1432141 RepID=A0A015L1D1_RHIIW|nr:hypothetical protein RirG_126730 [Rhizophagus irregularis DAOM 197198w]
MTSYTNKGPKLDLGNYEGFDHIKYWVGNAKQGKDLSYIKNASLLGFKHIGYQGLETGVRDVVSHVVRQNSITFVFQSPLNPNDKLMSDHQSLHGDGVKDVAFTVDDARGLWENCVQRGGKSIREPWEERDENGVVIMATIGTYGDTVHTFVERKNYHGEFLPNFRRLSFKDPLEETLPPANLGHIDHVVGNQPDLEMDQICEMYEKVFNFHRFWSVDDKQIHTEYSSLRSIVMADYHEKIKMPVNEPAIGRKKSQIQEYSKINIYIYILHYVKLINNYVFFLFSNLRARGLEFITIPDSYYDNLRERLQTSCTKILEDIEILQKLHILVDYDEEGYLLQIFTKPLQDRPTLFIEVIQRRNHQGFGAGNFKSLFEAIRSPWKLIICKMTCFCYKI